MDNDEVPRVLAGVRVLELAEWVFVPTAGTLLADQGADVIKIENAQGGDPYRMLQTHGAPPGVGTQMANRGKRSIALDLKSAAGMELFWEFVDRSDVLLTNFRPAAAERLGITPQSVQHRNPKIVYARGSGFGLRGPDRDSPGFDLTAFYSRGGLGHAVTSPEAEWPPPMPGAIGDRSGAVNLAFAVAAALLRAERSGVGSVVDVSLLATATWMMASDTMRASAGWTDPADRSRTAGTNPLVNYFPTADGRWVTLCLMQSDRYWEALCRMLDVPHLVTDERFVDHAARAQNRQECLDELDKAFRRRTLDEWRAAFSDFDAPWAPVQSPAELASDPQVVANEYVTMIDEVGMPTVRGPATFDETTPPLSRAPEFGEHTEEILLECGKTWKDIATYQNGGVIP